MDVTDDIIKQVQQSINDEIENDGDGSRKQLLLNKGGLNLLTNLKANGYAVVQLKAEENPVNGKPEYEQFKAEVFSGGKDVTVVNPN